MAAPYHNLLSKCDRALVAYILSKGIGDKDDVLPAKRSLNKIAPYTVCYSENSEETAPYSGTYTVKASVSVKTPTSLDDGQDEDKLRLESDALVATVFDAFHTNIRDSGAGLAADITNAARALAAEYPDRHGDLADLTIQSIRLIGPEASIEEETGLWVDALNIELVACPANVS